MEENILGKRLKEALNDSGLKLIELSEKTKIPKASLSQYISGYAKPKQDRIYLICKALNISEAWLMGYNVPKNDDEVLQLFEKLNPEQQNLILDMMRNMK